MIIQHHGLGIKRSENIVVAHMFNRRGKRTPAQKEKLYALLVRNLKRGCGLDPANLVASITRVMREVAALRQGWLAVAFIIDRSAHQ